MGLSEWKYVFIVAVVIACAAAIVIWQRRKTRRIIRTVHAMLDAAMDGAFTGQTFDETLLSSVESKLDSYLSASAVSSQSLAAERDKIKELIADISHQTKTPIANILLYAQLLGEQELTEESRACLKSLQSQAERLNFLIASLVKLSRLETGILTLHPGEAALQPLLNDVESQFAAKAAERGIALTLVPTDCRAVFDPKWTAEALANLVDNAIKYTQSGGSVAVSVRSYELFCRIDVADTGVGIAEDELSRVFARFYRSPSQSAQEGVGIGLYLVRLILAEQGGYVKVSSTPGEGSVFSLFLPAGREFLQNR